MKDKFGNKYYVGSAVIYPERDHSHNLRIGHVVRTDSYSIFIKTSSGREITRSRGEVVSYYGNIPS